VDQWRCRFYGSCVVWLRTLIHGLLERRLPFADIEVTVPHQLFQICQKIRVFFMFESDFLPRIKNFEYLICIVFLFRYWQTRWQQILIFRKHWLDTFPSTLKFTLFDIIGLFEIDNLLRW
jgi:hypothetical protein